MAELLDYLGRPVRRRELTEPQAPVSVGSLRSPWAEPITGGITPARLAAILRSAADGTTRDYVQLAQEMEEKDPVYASALGVRKRAVSGLSPVVTAASEDAQDVRIAEDVEAAISEHPDLPDLVEDMLDALGKGWSAMEIDWETSARQWSPRGFRWRDPRHFLWDRETGEELRLIDEADAGEGVALAPFRWIVHRPRLKSGLPLRGGLARLAAFGWVCKAYAVKDWVAFAEIYGMPLRLGRYGPEATNEDVRILARAVSRLGHDAAAVFPRSMEIEFQEAAKNSGEIVFEPLARWLDEQVTIGVLGQTMTTQDGSSLSQAKVHNDVRGDIQLSDARKVAAALTMQLVRPWVDLNYGPQARYPILTLPVPEAEDVAALTGAVSALVPLGMRVGQRALREKLGLPEPDKGEELLEAPAPSLPPGFGPPPAPGGPALATARANAETPVDPYAGIDRIAAETMLGWQGQMGPILDEI
ncbi:MAG: DUF935 domain-containing protein, partial [Pseudomonadota bacterium]